MVRNLSPAGDLREAAASLFGALHDLDAAGATMIAAMPIPAHGLGEAINDRLRPRRRAAAKKRRGGGQGLTRHRRMAQMPWRPTSSKP